MIKDLLLISIFLLFLVKYVLLYRNYIKQQDFFINTLSHDLRVSTIAQLRGLQMLKGDSNQSLINEIRNSCEFTFDMINMLLNSYKYEKKEEFLDFQKINLKQEIVRIYRNLSEKANEKNLKLQLNNNSNIVFDGNSEGINKILSILISIAISNAKKDSLIHISAIKENRHLNIKILYRGLCLTEEEEKRMFSNNPRFSTVGYGIKMLLCKKIIDFHKGKIFYKKQNKNLNSFTILLPLNKSYNSFKLSTISLLQPSKL